MAKTFDQAVTEVQRKTGRNDSDFRDRIEDAVNMAIRTWARLLPWPGLEEVGDIVHVGGRYLYLPGRVNKLIWLMDTDNDEEIMPSDQHWPMNYPSAFADDATGSVVNFEDYGLEPTFTGASGPLAVYSTDASDVVGVYVQGDLVPSGSAYSLGDPYFKYQGVEEISTNGQTPVTTSGVFVDVQSIGKTADSDGAIVIQCGGTTIGIIGPLEDESTYRKFALMKIPSAGTNLKYKGYTDPPKMVNTNQIIPVQVNFEFVVWKATADILWDVRETERALIAKKEAGAIAEQHIKQDMMFGAGGARIVPEDFS